MINKPDTINIPAYLRKRSIESKIKRTTGASRKSAARKKSASTRVKFSNPFEAIVNEMPIIDALPKEEIFPAPITEQTVDNRKVREMKTCGVCEGYFDKIEVAIIKLTGTLKVGERIIFEKIDGLFEQKVESMQINRKDVKRAKAGSDIGLKVAMKPNVGTTVYKVIQ